MINLKEIKPRHHLQLLKTFPKTTPKQSRRRTFICVCIKLYEIIKNVKKKLSKGTFSVVEGGDEV